MILAELCTHAWCRGNTMDPWTNVGCRQLFLMLRTRDHLGWIILCLKGFPIHWRMFRHIPGLYPLDARSTSSSRDNKKVSKCYQMCPRRHVNTAVVWCLRAALSSMAATSYLWWRSPRCWHQTIYNNAVVQGSPGNAWRHFDRHNWRRHYQHLASQSQRRGKTSCNSQDSPASKEHSNLKGQ